MLYRQTYTKLIIQDIHVSDGTNNFSSCLQLLAWLASGFSEILIFFHEWIRLCRVVGRINFRVACLACLRNFGNFIFFHEWIGLCSHHPLGRAMQSSPSGNTQNYFKAPVGVSIIPPLACPIKFYSFLRQARQAIAS